MTRTAVGCNIKAFEYAKHQFNGRFQDFATIEKDIFSSPFSVDPDDAPHQLQMELIELQCDSELCSQHQQLSFVNFYQQLNKG